MIAAALVLSLPAFAFADGDAAAEMEVPCFPPELVDHRPLDAQQDVPVDASLYMVFNTDSCYGDVAITVSTQGEALWTETADANNTSGILTVDPEGLSPNTDYEILVVALGYSEDSGTSFSFTTGTETAEVVSEPPEISISGVDAVSYAENAWSDSYTTYEVDFYVSAQPVASGISYVEVFDLANLDWPRKTVFVPTTGELDLAAFWIGEEEDEVCFAAVQIDATGARTVLGEMDCVEPDIQRPDQPGILTSCSTAGSGSGGLGLALLGLLGLVRRRENRS